MRQRRNRIKARRCNKFRSTLERNAAEDLDRRNIKYTYEPCAIEYSVNETKKYTPDFKLEGLPFYLEFKGWLTLEDRKKAIRVRRSNPDIEVRFVFQNSSNKIRRGSKTTYADWCNKNGFKWADVFVPQHWIDEKKNDSHDFDVITGE